MNDDLWLRLSDAHRELIRELATGKSMKQAAHALRISTRAAQFRWQACRERLGCETPAHAIALLAGDALARVHRSAEEIALVELRLAELAVSQSDVQRAVPNAVPNRTGAGLRGRIEPEGHPPEVPPAGQEEDSPPSIWMARPSSAMRSSTSTVTTRRSATVGRGS